MEEDNNVHNIFTLSDYSIIHIFKYVSSTDLYNLSLTCRRFEGLVKEKKLWHKIDARGNPNSKEKVKYCIDRINERTTDFLICSDQRDRQILPDDFFSSNACAKLTVLALENQIIRGDLARVSEYPKSLVELSLRKSFVNSHSTYFKLSYLQMENLKVLILDECGWVETYMLVQMSKYAKLEVLSLYKCKKLSDYDIAYLSLAGCFGFKQLRILDIRFTGLGDQILKTFYKHATLQELYFQSYISTYTVDKSRRHLAIAQGAYVNPHSYLSEYDDIPDTNLESLRKFFGNHNYRTCRRQNLSNEGTVMYKLVIPNIDDDYEVKSVLFKSPYAKCTCGYGEKYMPRDMNSIQKIRGPPYDYDKIAKLNNIIDQETNKKYSPYVYALAPKLQMDPYKSNTDICFYEEQASESNKQIDWINMREPLNLFEIAMFEHTDIHSLQSDIILPLDIMTALDCMECNANAVIVGNPGPELVDNNIMNAQLDELDDNSCATDENKDNYVIAGEVPSLENGDFIYDLPKQEVGDYEGMFRMDSSVENNLKTDCVEIGKEDNKESGSEDVNVINGASKMHKWKSLCHKNGEPSGSEVELRKSKNGKHKSKRLSKTNGDMETNYDKCRMCGAKISNTEHKISQSACHECSKRIKSDDVENNITSFKLQKSNQDKTDTDATTWVETNEVPENLPSTSKTKSPTPSPSKKRKRDNSTNTPDIKKFKSKKTEDRPNIPYANVNLGRSNTVYININMPEQDDDEPGLINVPMGGGLINILLGVDNKTKAAIKKLSLRGFPRVTDYTLSYLTSLKLDLLDITKTGITNSGVSNFIRDNPTCRVLHESACVCQPDMQF